MTSNQPKRRGRPPKNAQPTPAPVPAPAAPRKRGRPPKNAAAPAPQPAPAPVPAAPRKRGRPPKNAQPVAPPPAAAQPEKRRRGRPAKVAPPPVAPAPAAAEAPRRRGRPPKKQMPLAPAPVNATSAPGKRRGRPPKSLQRSRIVASAAASPAPAAPIAVPQEAPARPESPSVTLPTSNFTTAEINRVRVTELEKALASELAELERGLDKALEGIRTELRSRSREVISNLSASTSGIQSWDDPWALHLSATVEKLAHRLALFRSEPRPGIEDLAKLSARLGKAARKFRR